MWMDALQKEILTDLGAELELLDLETKEALKGKEQDVAILSSKIKNALREVRGKRSYPEHFSDEQIARDLEKHYSVIRNLALNDYNMIGAEFHKSISENGISRTFVDRDSILQSVFSYVSAF